VFLLVTAVWTQIARLEASQYGNGPQNPAPATTLAVTLRLGPQGHVVQLSTGEDVVVPALGRGAEGETRYDYAQLAAKLAELKRSHPDQAAITVAAEDEVRYADLVHTIDACVGAGLSGVSVTGHAG
jgi:biopolymer transport protein ExbD